NAIQLLFDLRDLDGVGTASRRILRFSEEGPITFEMLRAVAANMMSDISRGNWQSIYGMGEVFQDMIRQGNGVDQIREAVAEDHEFCGDLRALFVTLQRTAIPVMTTIVRTLYEGHEKNPRVATLLEFLSKIEGDYYKLTDALEIIFDGEWAAKIP